MKLAAELEQRQREQRPIRVGVVGVGQMGAGLIAQIGQMQGMDVVAAADIDMSRATDAFRAIGVNDDDIVTLSDSASQQQANLAIQAGKRVVTTNASLIPEITPIEAVVEATGIPSIGAL